MGRTTAEHEHLIDVLDNLITFCYAVEGELVANDGLDSLKTLASEVQSELPQILNMHVGLSTNQKRAVITRVLNVLHQAVRDGAPPQQADLGQAWANKPAVLTGHDLLKAHVEQRDGLLQLILAVITRLDTAFAPEVKPFVTCAQAVAVIRTTLPTMQPPLTAPIHVDALATLLHQHFLAAITTGEQLPGHPARWHAVRERYIERARQELREMVTQTFVMHMVGRMFSRGRQVRISIDRHYPWGALWLDPIQGKDLLDRYTDLNRAGALNDAKFRRSAARCENAAMRAHAFIASLRYFGLRPPERRDISKERHYYVSDRDDIQIGGKAIQKCAIMAIRYDRPLHDLEKALAGFGTFVLAQRRGYCANGIQALTAEETAAERFVTNAVRQAKTARTVLHDMSSVLGHICAIISLQMRRDPGYAKSLQKNRLGQIEDWVKQAGFAFKEGSIRKACSNASKEAAAIRLRISRS